MENGENDSDAEIGFTKLESNCKVKMKAEYVIEDSRVSVDALTKEYDLHELIDFFGSNNMNETTVLNMPASTLLLHEVDKRYPVEIIRDEQYSVFKVRDGGYFYVFWATPITDSESKPKEELAVYFTSYLDEDRNISAFESLEIGISTAADVKEIDPFFELTFLMSSGIFSYSFLDEANLLEIEYERNSEITEYTDLIIKEMTVISRDSSPSRYSSICLEDLP